MTSGNHMVDQGGYRENATTCPKCNGNGFIKWNDVEEWTELFHDEFRDNIYQWNKRRIANGKAEMTFIECLHEAREMRLQGAVCPRCEGVGMIW